MSTQNADETSFVLLKPKRWFLWSVAGIMGFLLGAILLAALILMRTGQTPRTAWIIGNSMEPKLFGPAITWKCDHCSYLFRFGRESLHENQPLICPFCKKISGSPTYQLLVDQKEDLENLEQVQYFLRSFAAARRKKSEQQTEFQGFLRGDLVVFNAPDLGRKEIKRVLGFPGESLEIREGDLWIDQQRWSKTSEELLLQSVLIAHHARSSIPNAYWFADSTRLPSPPHRQPMIPPPIRLGDESTSLSFRSTDGLIDNQLIYNLHDSHAPVAVHDIGAAIQLGSSSSEWSVRWSIASANRSTAVQLKGTPERWTGVYGDLCVQTDAPERLDSERTDWLIFAIVDGHAVVAFNQLELFRWTLEDLATSSSEPEDSRNETREIVRIQCEEGHLQVHEMLLFRDIHYRGHGDSPEQSISDGGFVLLGDNVSLSHDARQRWPEGIASEQINGILEPNQTGIENLLRQRQWLPQLSD